ncbi:MAG: SRPBCC domain-containing protein [Bacteroidota bacterium]
MKLTYKINKPSEVIFNFLTDMQKFASVHPVITQIDNLGGNNYLVHETLKLGVIPFSFTYPVTIEDNAAEQLVVMRATVMRFTKIEIYFIIKSVNGSSIIEETIHFNSPLLSPVLQHIFRKQHNKLFKNIADFN